MLLTEIIVDMIKTSLHGLPLGEKRRVILASTGHHYIWCYHFIFLLFFDIDALDDCAAAANLYITKNASDISNTSDLYYICFGAVRH